MKQELVEYTTEHVNSNSVITKVKSRKTKPEGPKLVWVPKKD